MFLFSLLKGLSEGLLDNFHFQNPVGACSEAVKDIGSSIGITVHLNFVHARTLDEIPDFLSKTTSLSFTIGAVMLTKSPPHPLQLFTVRYSMVMDTHDQALNAFQVHG